MPIRLGGEVRTEARLARVIEGDHEPAAIDAPHWVRVYQELVTELRDIVAHHPDQAVALAPAMEEFEHRLRFWDDLARRPRD